MNADQKNRVETLNIAKKIFKNLRIPGGIQKVPGKNLYIKYGLKERPSPSAFDCKRTHIQRSPKTNDSENKQVYANTCTLSKSLFLFMVTSQKKKKRKLELTF